MYTNGDGFYSIDNTSLATMWSYEPPRIIALSETVIQTGARSFCLLGLGMPVPNNPSGCFAPLAARAALSGPPARFAFGERASA